MFQPTNHGNQSVQRQPTTQTAAQNPVDRRCINCGERGHFANACPKPHAHTNQTPTAQSTPSRNNFTPMTTRKNFARGKINHVAIEDTQEAPDVVLGMLQANSNTVITLFDSGASHSFIYAEYVAKYNLPVSLLK
jgi:hypothetical protein